MISPFNWENRYVVFKRKDLALLSENYQRYAEEFFDKLNAHLTSAGAPDRQMVVIEGDWPEYQPVCEALQARILNESEAKFLTGEHE